MNDQTPQNESIVFTMPTIQNPPEFRTVYLGGIFLILLFTVFYHVSVIVLPIILAFILKLMLQPLMRLMDKIGLSRLPSAVVVLLILTIGVVGLGTALAGPTSDWVERMPAGIDKAQERLVFLSRPMQSAQKFLARADTITVVGGEKVRTVALPGSRLSERVFLGIKLFAGELITTLLILFFLLASGDTFLRRLVEVLPRFKDKRQAVDISQNIEHHISKYLVTITMMNLLVGIATGLTMELCGLGEPLLWGTMAFLLNYVPILGPLTGVCIFFLAGTMVMESDNGPFVIAAIYFMIHIMEGTFITPMLLAKRFTLNPVLVIISLIFWYWMWGVPGAILAVPMLAIIKIICDRIDSMKAFGHFLEG